MNCFDFELDIVTGLCSDAVVRGAGMTEPGMGREFDMDTGLDTGLRIGFDTGSGMLELLW
jgi:hypothetical protein